MDAINAWVIAHPDIAPAVWLLGYFGTAAAVIILVNLLLVRPDRVREERRPFTLSFSWHFQLGSFESGCKFHLGAVRDARDGNPSGKRVADSA